MKVFVIISFLSFSLLAETILTSHKGAWNDNEVPQNSLESLKRAVRNGFRAVEFDVLLTADNQFILAHDQKLKRITTCKGEVSEKTMLSLQECFIDKNTQLPMTQLWLKKVAHPQKMTSLSEALDYLLTKSQLELIWIDMKEQSPEAAYAMANEINGRDLEERELRKIVINNGSIEILRLIQKLIPAVGRSLEGKWGSEPLSKLDYYFNEVRDSYTHLSLNVGIHLGDESPIKIFGRKKRFYKRLKELSEKANEMNIPIIAWTVNREKKIEKLMEFGFTYLLTDHVDPNHLSKRKLEEVSQKLGHFR